MRFYTLLLMMLALAHTACGGAVDPNTVDMSRALRVSGDLDVRGTGEICLFDAVCMEIKGYSAATGSVDLDGDGEGDACAGVQISIGQWQWSHTDALQSDAACEVLAGESQIIAAPPGFASEGPGSSSP